MRLSARNVLPGKVVAVTEGAVNDEVTLELDGGARVVSVITRAAVKSLGLAPGKKAYAVIKASNVIVAVD